MYVQVYLYNYTDMSFFPVYIVICIIRIYDVHTHDLN